MAPGRGMGVKHGVAKGAKASYWGSYPLGLYS